MLKVALVYPIPFGAEGYHGGGERYALELGKALAARAPTRLISFGPSRRQQELGPLLLDIYPWITLVRGMRENPLAFSFLPGLFQADVIHCLSWHTLVTDLCILFARATRKRVFVTDVGGGGDLSLSDRLPLASWVSRFLFLSSYSARAFGPRARRFSVIYGGVDVARFAPSPSDSEKRGVLFVGRLLPHKGVNYLIEALEDSVPLRLVGRPYHGPYYQLLRELSAGKLVTFLTDADDEALIREYQGAALTVLPSVYQDVYGGKTQVPELLGLTLMESMACSTPVVATAVGSLPEIVPEGEAGFLVPPNDPQALRSRISLLLEDRALRQRLGEGAREWVASRFTWERVAAACLQWYNQP